MSSGHDSYQTIARRRRGRHGYREGYEEARRAFLIGQAVRKRRLELGLSQTEVATRADMTQPALSRLEAGGAVPTIPVLERLAAALNADLIVTLTPHAA
jgi:ribosome-binding protein aMBF1 (putative translation factor)